MQTHTNCTSGDVLWVNIGLTEKNMYLSNHIPNPDVFHNVQYVYGQFVDRAVGQGLFLALGESCKSIIPDMENHLPGVFLSL